MRIITWNVNAIKTLSQYHPWNALKTFDAILDELGADILCFQEMKCPRSAMSQQYALPTCYDAFLSFPSNGSSQSKVKAGYSGSGTYTRRSPASEPPSYDKEKEMYPHPCFPVAAEEKLCFPPPSQLGSRISKSEDAYPANLEGQDDNVIIVGQIDYEEDEDMDMDGASTSKRRKPGVYDEPQEDWSHSSLDSEGRSMILDFGLFVLINVYCPNDGPTRTAYKAAYQKALKQRVRALVAEGREVIVVGDLNACAFPIDHCEGDLDDLLAFKGLEDWYSGPSNSNARRWLKDWLVDLPLSDEEKESPTRPENVKLVDIVRLFHPGRKAMYTCWNTILSARESNYGARIDYILVTKGLLKWIKYADILPGLRGSDHCPVYVDFHHSIPRLKTDEPHPVSPTKDCNVSDSATIRLHDVLGAPPGSEPPKLATRFWDEYSGKQMRLDKFFGGRATKGKSEPSSARRASEATLPSTQNSESATPAAEGEIASSAGRQVGDKRKSTQPESSMASKKVKTEEEHASAKEKPSAPPLERKSSSSTVATSKPSKTSKSKKASPEKEDSQKTLASFFGGSGAKGKGKAKATDGTQRHRSSSVLSKTNGRQSQPSPKPEDIIDVDEADPVDEEADYKLALSLSQQSSESTTSSGSGPKSTKKSKEAWTTLFTPVPPPKCPVHEEPGKKFTVNKKGANKGRAFWVCSRPVGPGYDRGRETRPREDVNDEYRCNFFMWCSDYSGAKKEEMK